MDEDTIKLNIQTVEDLVLDEEKLVTYIYLSKKLCIHVNESKELLSLFVKKCKNNNTNPKIYVNYLVSGLLADNKARTQVCSEHDLERVKGEFKSVFFEHIYSISKGPVADNATLSAINNFSDFQLCLGFIKSKSCQKHSEEEISKLKNHSHESGLKTTLVSKAPSNQINRKPKQEPVDDTSNSAVKVSTEVSVKTETKKSPKKTLPSPATKTKGIGGFFNKLTLSKQVQNKPITTGNKKADIEVKKEEQVEKPIKEEREKPKIIEEKEKSNKVTDIKVEKSHEETTNEVKIDKKKAKTKKPIDDIKKNAKVDKKRKRVLHLSDSDSDDQNDPFVNTQEQNVEIIDSDDEIPPTPTNNVVKITSGVLNPRKKRKLVDKVYTDEDGYILTKKEEVYESCSDNDEPKDEKKHQLVDMKENILIQPSPKKIAPSPKKDKRGKKKVSPPQKGKQATIMNFFTKK